MATDKDSEEAQNLWTALTTQYGDSIESVAKEIARIRAESAEQARKEAADRLCKFLIDEKCYFVLRGKTITESDIRAILNPLQNVGNGEQVPTKRNRRVTKNKGENDA